MPKIFLSLSAALLLAGAAHATTKAIPPEQSADELRQQIMQQVADARCDSNQQCHTLPMGAKACGGPESYLPWSDRSLNGERLRQLAERYAEARRFELQRDAMMSNCALITDPGAVCRAQRCVLQPRSPGQGNPLAQ